LFKNYDEAFFKKKKWRGKYAFAEVYFFFAGAFFTAFLAGFFATTLTSGLNLC
jgi:hypothetical protein